MSACKQYLIYSYMIIATTARQLQDYLLHNLNMRNPHRADHPPETEDVWTWLCAASIHHGDSLAVVEVETDTLLTYHQLHQHAVHAAAYLAHRGLHSGARIGVLARNSAAVLTAHFAAAATRAVVVNCNTQLAPSELSYVLENAQVEVLIADARLAALVNAATSIPVIWVGGEVNSWQRIVSGEERGGDEHANATDALLTSIRASASPDDQYQLYHTSGTTGKPKAVVLTHSMVALHAIAAAEHMHLDASDVWCHVAPMYHLVDAFAIYAVTLVGGRHVVVPAFEASELPLVIGTHNTQQRRCHNLCTERERVTVTNMASTMLALLVSQPLLPAYDLTSLRLVSCGGSAQSDTVVQRAIALLGCQVFVSYGMTESCGKIAMTMRRDLPTPDDKPEDLVAALCSSGMHCFQVMVSAHTPQAPSFPCSTWRSSAPTVAPWHPVSRARWSSAAPPSSRATCTTARRPAPSTQTAGFTRATWRWRCQTAASGWWTASRTWCSWEAKTSTAARSNGCSWRTRQ